MNISQYLLNKGFTNFEGNCSTCIPEMQLLAMLTQTTDNKHINVMEIGFNAGNSAEVFLRNNKNLTLTSFDIGEHDYVAAAKSYIDDRYPGRHTLILGDSTVTVPNFSKNNDMKFDVIFIDGGHTYEVAKADMENCYHLANKDTVVIFDDVVYIDSMQDWWNTGPTNVWNEFKKENRVIEIDKKIFNKGVGVAYGKYNFE